MSSSSPAYRVLVVDDEPNSRRGRDDGRYQGFTVESADTGAAATAAATSLGPDLIVLDVMLPTWTGSP